MTDKQERGKAYKDVPYFQCLLCNKAYVAMYHISLRVGGVIYLCKGCHQDLHQSITSFFEKADE